MMEIMSDTFLQTMKNNSYAVNVFLTSGIKLSGTIKAFDNIAILMAGQTTQLVYKHSISTIQQETRRHD